MAVNPSIENMISQQNACFFVGACNKQAFVSYEEATNIIKVHNWSTHEKTEAVDINIETAFRFTNSNSVDECCKIMELHLLTGGLSLCVFFSEYRCEFDFLAFAKLFLRLY